MTLLQPFSDQLPNTQEQFNSMCRTLRRHGHISERLPGNIASALHGPATQARAGAYMALDNPVAQSPDQGTASFLGSTELGQAASSWDSLLPSTLTSGNPFTAWSDPGQASNPLQSSAQHASFPVTWTQTTRMKIGKMPLPHRQRLLTMLRNPFRPIVLQTPPS